MIKEAVRLRNNPEEPSIPNRNVPDDPNSIPGNPFQPDQSPTEVPFTDLAQRDNGIQVFSIDFLKAPRPQKASK